MRTGKKIPAAAAFVVSILLGSSAASAREQEIPTNSVDTPEKRDLTVHVLDALRKPVEGATVELGFERPASGLAQKKKAITDRDGTAVFTGALGDCDQVAAEAVFEGVGRAGEKRDCSEVSEIFLVLPDSNGAKTQADLLDKDGNKLPPPAPALENVPYIYDPKYSARFGNPGMFGLQARAGIDFCAAGLYFGSRNCAEPGIGASFAGSVFIHLVSLWKISAAIGATGGYRFDPNPLDEGAALDRENHLVILGPSLLLQGDASDWVFGIDAVPVGMLWRFTKSKAIEDGISGGESVSNKAFGAFSQTSFFLGWRAWGHLPVGLYLELFGPMSSLSDELFPAGSVTVGVFVGRRFGRGNSIWDIEEEE